MDSFGPEDVLREPHNLAPLEALGAGPYWGRGHALLRTDTGLSVEELDGCLDALEEAGLVEVRRGELLGMGTAHAELTEAGRTAGRAAVRMAGQALGALETLGSQDREPTPGGSREDLWWALYRQGILTTFAPSGRSRTGELGVGSVSVVVDPVGDARKLTHPRKLTSTRDTNEEHGRAEKMENHKNHGGLRQQVQQIGRRRNNR